MATKYRREGYADRATGTHGQGARPARRTLTLKQRLLYIYLGILVFCVLMLVFRGLGLDKALSMLPEVEGSGLVVDQRVVQGDPSRYFVTVEVVLPASESSDPAKRLRDEVEVPAESYALVERGTRLSARYQINRTRNVLVVNGLQLLDIEPLVEAPPAPTPPSAGEAPVDSLP